MTTSDLTGALELVRYLLAELSDAELDRAQTAFIRGAVADATPRATGRLLASVAKLIEAEQRRRRRLLSDLAWSLDPEPTRGARVLDIEEEIAAARRQLRGER